jgi:hypothetical protein
MKNALIFALGLFLIAGAAGGQDFYDECKAAADCVAGDPPSMFLTIVQCIVGMITMFIGVSGMLKEND